MSELTQHFRGLRGLRGLRDLLGLDRVWTGPGSLTMSSEISPTARSSFAFHAPVASFFVPNAGGSVPEPSH